MNGPGSSDWFVVQRVRLEHVVERASAGRILPLEVLALGLALACAAVDVRADPGRRSSASVFMSRNSTSEVRAMSRWMVSRARVDAWPDVCGGARRARRRGRVHERPRARESRPDHGAHRVRDDRADAPLHLQMLRCRIARSQLATIFTHLPSRSWARAS